MGNVQGQVLTVNNIMDKARIVWDQLVTAVHDEHMMDILFDVVLVFTEVKGS